MSAEEIGRLSEPEFEQYKTRVQVFASYEDKQKRRVNTYQKVLVRFIDDVRTAYITIMIRVVDGVKTVVFSTQCCEIKDGRPVILGDSAMDFTVDALLRTLRLCKSPVPILVGSLYSEVCVSNNAHVYPQPVPTVDIAIKDNFTTEMLEIFQEIAAKSNGGQTTPVLTQKTGKSKEKNAKTVRKPKAAKAGKNGGGVVSDDTPDSGAAKEAAEEGDVTGQINDLTLSSSGEDGSDSEGYPATGSGSRDS